MKLLIDGRGVLSQDSRKFGAGRTGPGGRCVLRSARESRNLSNQGEEACRPAAAYCPKVFLPSGRVGTALVDVFIVLYIDLIIY